MYIKSDEIAVIKEKTSGYITILMNDGSKFEVGRAIFKRKKFNEGNVVIPYLNHDETIYLFSDNYIEYMEYVDNGWWMKYKEVKNGKQTSLVDKIYYFYIILFYSIMYNIYEFNNNM